MDSAKIIKLLQIRKHNTNCGFFSHYEGPIITKGTFKAKRLSETVKSKFEKDAEQFGWEAPPRARIAINFRIFCNEKNPPEIYRIIKYYLDLLNGPVFQDDRQVHYLEAAIWRSFKNGPKSGIYIQARRLIDLFKIWDIYQDIDVNTNDSDYKDVLFPRLHLINKDLWDAAKAQHKILRHSRVSEYDRPGLIKYIGTSMMSRFCGIDPLVFDMGHLPANGETNIFQNNVHNSISNFGSKYPLFRKIYLPIELDIQVTKTSHKHFTDLDNVATKICKEYMWSMKLRRVLEQV